MQLEEAQGWKARDRDMLAQLVGTARVLLDERDPSSAERSACGAQPTPSAGGYRTQ